MRREEVWNSNWRLVVVGLPDVEGAVLEEKVQAEKCKPDECVMLFLSEWKIGGNLVCSRRRRREEDEGKSACGCCSGTI